MWVLTLQDILSGLSQLLWPFFRITAFFMVVPVIGTRLVPVRIRLVLAIMFTWMLVPSINHNEYSINLLQSTVGDRASWWILMSVSAKEILIGLVLGFSVQVLFHIAVLGGQMIAMQNGLGFATLVDPINGINVAALGQLYLMLMNLLFLTMNGHLAVLQMLTESFSILPIQQVSVNFQGLYELATLGGWLFAAGLLVALPAVTALLLVNLAFGLMAKMAPSLNIFSVGFPFNMVFGLFMIWLCLQGFLPQFERFTLEHLDFMRLMMLELRSDP